VPSVHASVNHLSSRCGPLQAQTCAFVRKGREFAWFVHSTANSTPDTGARILITTDKAFSDSGPVPHHAIPPVRLRQWNRRSDDQRPVLASHSNESFHGYKPRFIKAGIAMTEEPI